MSYLIPIVTRYSCVIRDRWIRNVTYVFRVKNIGNSIRIKVKLDLILEPTLVSFSDLVTV